MKSLPLKCKEYDLEAAEDMDRTINNIILISHIIFIHYK